MSKLGRCPKDILDEKIFEKLFSEGLIEVVDAFSSRADKNEAEVPEPAITETSPRKRKTVASPSKKKVKFIASGIDEGPKQYVRLALKPLVNLIWHEQLVQHSTRRINNAAGSIMETVMALSGASTDTSRTLLNSFQVSHRLPADVQLLVDTDGASGRGRGSGGSPLAQYLETMAQELPYFIKSGDQAGGQFFVDLQESKSFLITQFILAQVQARFGQPSARIMRILLAKKYLEERNIAKIAMLTGKEARERLFILMQHGFVHMQEIPKTADHAPSRTIYLWTVPMDRLKFSTTERILKAILNIMERIQHERSKFRNLITKTERSDVAANLAGLLSSLERAQLEALNHVLNRLEFQISRIIIEYIIFACI